MFTLKPHLLWHPQQLTCSFLCMQLFIIQLKRVVLFVQLQMPPQGFSLLIYTGDHLVVYVCEQEFRIGLQTFFSLLKRLHHRLARLLPPAPLIILTPPAASCHVMSQPGDGMVLLVPVIHLIHWTVCRAVITGAVVANSEDRAEIISFSSLS